MAQAGISREPIAIASGYQPGGQNGSLTTADLEEIREYQKVISFRDTIVSGKHPRIKVAAKPTTPQQAQAQAASLATERVASSPSFSQPLQPLQNAPNLNYHQVDNLNSFKVNSQQPAIAVVATGRSGASSAFIPGVSTPLDHSKTPLDPVLYQNPKDHAEAGLEMQRRKIEQDLRDQFEQRSVLQYQSEHIDLDLPDILAKALTLVQATAPISTDTPNLTTISDSSDSFDEHTFYSSPHETPISRASPRVQNVIGQDVAMQDTTPQRGPHAPPLLKPQPRYVFKQPIHTSAPLYQQDLSPGVQPIQIASGSHTLPSSTSVPAKAVQGRDHELQQTSKPSREASLVTQFRQLHHMEPQVISSDSGPTSRSDNGNTDSDQPTDYSRLQFPQHPQYLLPAAPLRQQQPPLVRTHGLLPYAPQPAHISSLATARRPPASDPDISILPGAPAQVTALRQERGVVTSPESSPQGEKRGKKNNKKKNKRKAGTRASDVPGSPYIKPEPRSPSPLSAPQFIRPQKRLRSDPHQQPELAYDEPRIERPVSVIRREPFTATHTPTERPPYGFERVDDPYVRQVPQSVAPASQRLEHAVYEERRVDGTAVQYIQRVQSPYGYAAPYGAVESRPLRSASYSLNPQYREVSAYPRDGRMSVRPYADRARSRSPVIIERRSPVMAPPAPPSRIIVDEYGREYLEPPRSSTVARHSVVPGPRPGEREIVYERVPARIPSRMSRETFEEDGVIYRRASPTYAPRRVVTQPEYGVDYRSYRERDYPMQPIGVPGQDFVPIRGATGGRGPEELPRDYLSRAATVRPAEAAPYYSRHDTVRPDIPPRHYAASVHPEVRRDAVPPVVREYSVRPAEHDAPRREYSVRPVDRLYDRPPHAHAHADEDVTYIERPRAAQPEIIYADNSRRHVYQ
ncbi:hypothetical protein F4781DRAFT_261459 [Annulohypoxylon bovei var. microspora]|nr:hypothetical protein F4781DRAFT_261459 [Annulohypoxylon bovei var. microspora]